MNQEKMKMFEKIGKEESRNSESIFNPLKPEGIKIILFFFSWGIPAMLKPVPQKPKCQSISSIYSIITMDFTVF